MTYLESKGLADFWERYRPENIVEYDQAESRLLPRLEQCLNCGLCLAVCPVLRGLMVRVEEYAGPRSIATSLSRSVPHFWATSDTIYYCTLCGACEAICPGQVPIPEIVAMIRGKLSRQSGGAVPPAHVALADNLKEFANVYGEPIEPLSHRRHPTEFVYFAGCVGSYLERESVENTRGCWKSWELALPPSTRSAAVGRPERLACLWSKSSRRGTSRLFWPLAPTRLSPVARVATTHCRGASGTLDDSRSSTSRSFWLGLSGRL